MEIRLETRNSKNMTKEERHSGTQEGMRRRSLLYFPIAAWYNITKTVGESDEREVAAVMLHNLFASY